MKTTLMLAILAFASISGFAQNTADNKTPELKNNGKEVFVRPTFDRPFRVLFNPPCIEYKRHGVVTMECPGIMMAPETGDYDKSMYTGYGNTVPNPTTSNNNWKQESEDNKSLSKK